MKTLHINSIRLLTLGILSLLLSCKSGSNAPVVEDARGIRTGDLLFVGIPVNYFSDDYMAGAIAAATGGGDSLDIVHVAILEVPAPDSVFVIDATIAHGVERHPLDTLYSDFYMSRGGSPTLIVKRLKDASEKELADWVAQAKSFAGQPYDQHFLPANGALYCSELVHESFVREDGSFLFENQPMNFKGPDGEVPLYGRTLFGMLGEPIPQGVPGTNPQAMCESPLLEPVCIFQP